MQSFLAWSKKEHAAHPDTHRRYKTSSVALLRYFGDVSLDSVTAAEVERFKTERRGQFVTVRGRNGQRKQTKKRIKPATMNRELACIRAMFNHIIKDDVRLRNPVSKTGAKVLQEGQRTDAHTISTEANLLREALGSGGNLSEKSTNYPVIKACGLISYAFVLRT